jgi:hypothetical protein
MTVYETSLPSMHLAGDELTDFENVIKSDTTNPEFSVTIKKDGFEYNLKSMNELIENHDVPDLVEEYQVYLKCDEGEVRLNTKYSRGGSLRLSGETEWVRKKKRQISAQIEKNKILFRTHFSKIGFWGLRITMARFFNLFIHYWFCRRDKY